MSFESLELSYLIDVQGLEEVAGAAETAAKSADAAARSVNNLKVGGSSTLPMLLTGLRTINSVRNAVNELQRAFTDFKPEVILFLLLDMIHIVMNLTRLVKMLQTSTAAASAAQAVLATLSGNLWLIPLALAAGALVASSLRSYQSGGLIPETGVYTLHKGEYVVPASQTTSYGPFFVNFSKQPTGVDADRFLREIGPELARQIRRGG